MEESSIISFKRFGKRILYIAYNHGKEFQIEQQEILQIFIDLPKNPRSLIDYNSFLSTKIWQERKPS